MEKILIACYLAGGTLEVLGIALVAWEIRADRTRAKAIAKRPPTSFPAPMPHLGSSSVLRDHERRTNPAEFARKEAEAASKLQTNAAMAAYRSEAESREMILELVAGNLRLRTIGVALLVAGVIVSTGGNVVSAAVS